MNHPAIRLAAVAVVTLTLQAPTRARAEEPRVDPTRGAIVVVQGTPGGAPACAQCHAFNGVSDASGAFPRLAGQSEGYLAKQLLDFASGVRKSPLMSQIARGMSAQEVRDTAAYYAALDAPFLPLKRADGALLQRGRELAVRGSSEGQIPACNACHGPGGSGEPPLIPYLAGQYASYITSTLEMWKRGHRQNSPGGMAPIARKLEARDIAAVAAYYQQLTPGNASVSAVVESR